MLRHNKVFEFGNLIRRCFKNITFFLKCFFKSIWIFLIILYVKLAKHNWHLSKNYNHYNPSLEATVYKWGKTWNIARHNVHYNGYKTKRLAKQAAFEMWLDDKQYFT